MCQSHVYHPQENVRGACRWIKTATATYAGCLHKAEHYM